MARTLPTNHLPSTQQRTNCVQLRDAQLRAQILSEDEKVDIARAQRERNAIRYHARVAVKEANVIAARKAGKSDEGLTVEAGAHRNFFDIDSKEGGLSDGMKCEKEEDVQPYGSIGENGRRGYEVAEYDVSEYDIGEYNVSEYKSVYE